MSRANTNPLHIAVENKNYDEIKRLLEESESFQEDGSGNRSPLGIALANNDFKAVALFILHSHTPNDEKYIADKIIAFESVALFHHYFQTLSRDEKKQILDKLKPYWKWHLLEKIKSGSNDYIQLFIQTGVYDNDILSALIKQNNRELLLWSLNNGVNFWSIYHAATTLRNFSSIQTLFAALTEMQKKEVCQDPQAPTKLSATFEDDHDNELLKIFVMVIRSGFPGEKILSALLSAKKYTLICQLVEKLFSDFAQIDDVCRAFFSEIDVNENSKTHYSFLLKAAIARCAYQFEKKLIEKISDPALTKLFHYKKRVMEWSGVGQFTKLYMQNLFTNLNVPFLDGLAIKDNLSCYDDLNQFYIRIAAAPDEQPTPLVLEALFLLLRQWNSNSNHYDQLFLSILEETPEIKAITAARARKTGNELTLFDVQLYRAYKIFWEGKHGVALSHFDNQDETIRAFQISSPVLLKHYAATQLPAAASLFSGLAKDHSKWCREKVLGEIDSRIALHRNDERGLIDALLVLKFLIADQKPQTREELEAIIERWQSAPSSNERSINWDVLGSQPISSNVPFYPHVSDRDFIKGLSAHLSVAPTIGASESRAEFAT